MNPFQKIKSRIEENVEQKNEEQRQRIERLAELEAAQNRKGFHIPNPVQSMKDKKEIKKLKKEIAAFEESKRNNKIVIGCAALVIVLIGFCGVMAAFEKEDLPSDTKPSVSMHEYSEPTIPTTIDSTDSISTETQATEENETPVEETASFQRVIEQYGYRKDFILKSLAEDGIPVEFDAVIARGGLLKPTPGGVYAVNERMKHDLVHAHMEHASNLGK